MEHEFKRMLGIHKLDHIDFFAKETQALLKSYYPNLELNIKQLGEYEPHLRTYLNQHVRITISLNGKTVERETSHVDNDILHAMMRELDPL